MLKNPYGRDAIKQRMINLYLIEEKSIAQIGEEFGCSRQWVNLVLKSANVATLRRRMPAKPKKKTEDQMRKEAEKELGFRRCSVCKLLKRIKEDFYNGVYSRCKECNDKLAQFYQRTEKGKSTARAWQKANQDKVNAAQRRYRQRRKEREETETS